MSQCVALYLLQFDADSSSYLSVIPSSVNLGIAGKLTI